jgi:hypothetical protein
MEGYMTNVFDVRVITKALHVPAEYLIPALELRALEVDPAWNPPDEATCARAETPPPEPPYDGSLKQRRYWKKVKEV